MKLSDLKTGERGTVVKVLGHGGFRKRIVEMGFINGKEVEVLLNAPLQDPVKYKIMGYELSLRHDEARMIEVVKNEDVHEDKPADEHAADKKEGNEAFHRERTWHWWATRTAGRRRSSTLPAVRTNGWATTRA